MPSEVIPKILIENQGAAAKLCRFQRSPSHLIAQKTETKTRARRNFGKPPCHFRNAFLIVRHAFP